MKKALKISGIVLLSVFGVVLLAAVLVCTVVFTPKFLTSTVNRALRNYPEITIGRADLALAGTYPFMSIHVEEVRIADAASFPDVYLAFDVKSLLKSGDLIVESLSLRDGRADIPAVTGILGKYGNGEKEEAEPESSFSLENLPCLDIRSIEVKNLSLLYSDPESRIDAAAEGLDINLNFRFSEGSADGKLGMQIAGASFSMDSTVFAKDLPVSLELPFSIDIPAKSIDLQKSSVTAGDFTVNVSGNASASENGAIETDLDASIASWDVEKLAALLPEQIRKYIDEYGAAGKVSLTANAKGTMSDSTMPVINARLNLQEARGKYSEYAVSGINSDMDIVADLNGKQNISADIESLSADFRGAKISLAGTVEDITGKMLCDADVKAQLPMKVINGFLPDSLRAEVSGDMDMELSVKADMDQIARMATDEIQMKALMKISGFNARYRDSITAGSSLMTVNLALNDPSANGSMAGAAIHFEDLAFDMGDIHAEIGNAGIKAGADGSLSDLEVLSAFCDFDIESISGKIGDAGIYAASPSGTLSMSPSGNAKRPTIFKVTMSGDSAGFSATDSFAEIKNFAAGGQAACDTSGSSILQKWNPDLKLSFSNGSLSVPAMEETIAIPSLDVSYSDDTLRIADSKITMAGSDFSLTGIISKIDDFISGKELLTADLGFSSASTDVDQLLSCFSGMGTSPSDSTVLQEEPAPEDLTNPENDGDPFIVPKGIDITLNTDIKRAVAFGSEISNVKGEVTVKDGVAILRQLGFTSDAARMQLTAVYKSPRRNHLFAGIDFHLIDIEIDKLIKMIPDIDSIVPMLKSFSGQAEFHLAVETYLNSKYELKKSTLLGAASIEGKDLIVLDSETFDQIAKMLMFSKKTVNKIDTLVVDMTVFRDEVDIYPFLVSMDNYKVILSGRHNLDMSFNYHLDCLSPVRLGLDVKGSLGDLKFSLTPTRYKNLFVPERRNDMQERTIKLMDMINDSLKEGVKRD